MRLWHYKLIPFLPQPQLLAQWRELNSIFKKQDKHVLINYIYEYEGKEDLFVYTVMVMEEMKKRKIKIKTTLNACNYFGLNVWNFPNVAQKYATLNFAPFKNHHNTRYLLQCFYNLQEKYDRGQKGYTKEQYEKLYAFVRDQWLDS